MNEPHILYADEVSPDQVKAIVSDVNSVFANLAIIQRALGLARTREDIGERISGVMVMPVGRYVCLISRSTGAGKTRGPLGMVLLDLAERVDVGYKIAAQFAEQFDNKELEDRFMDVMTEIVWHPERHATFKIVLGKPPRGLFR